MTVGVPRERRLSFGPVADLYERVRPSYPEALVDDVLDHAGVGAGERVLEVGAGTGKATRLFAARDHPVVALEPSPEMAAVARRACAGFPNVAVVEFDFESWPVEPAGFKLLISAQAWHWTDPDTRYATARRAVVAGGALAVFWNRPDWPACALGAALAEAYRRAAPELAPTGPMHPATAHDLVLGWRDEIDAADGFERAEVRGYPWTARYTAGEYARLLCTHLRLHRTRAGRSPAAARRSARRSGTTGERSSCRTRPGCAWPGHGDEPVRAGGRARVGRLRPLPGGARPGLERTRGAQRRPARGDHGQGGGGRARAVGAAAPDGRRSLPRGARRRPRRGDGRCPQAREARRVLRGADARGRPRLLAGHDRLLSRARPGAGARPRAARRAAATSVPAIEMEGAPALFSELEIRPTLGGLMFSGDLQPVTGGWVALGEDEQPLDAARLCALCDLGWPALYGMLSSPAALPTLQLTVHLRDIAGPAPAAGAGAVRYAHRARGSPRGAGRAVVGRREVAGGERSVGAARRLSRRPAPPPARPGVTRVPNAPLDAPAPASVGYGTPEVPLTPLEEIVMASGE